MLEKNFWNRKKVFITGHTGFKGSWLCLLLHALQANIIGYALQPPTNPSLFDLSRLEELITSVTADINDREVLRQALNSAEPEIVFHLAAQSLVRYSYINPIETYETNVMGTVNLLDAVKESPTVRAVVIITSDKCYHNNEWRWGYRENEPLGGYDPYSSSKACAELVTAAYRNSFFTAAGTQRIAIATARAGNVIGGGDWAPDRLLPDCIKALLKGEQIRLRSPNAIRPWQHVLDALSGYLMLAQALDQKGIEYASAWNFGPDDSDIRPVSWVVNHLLSNIISSSNSVEIEQDNLLHEATYLKLDSTKARTELHWYPKWRIEQALNRVIEWTNAYQEGLDAREICLRQISDYLTFNSQSETMSNG